MSQIELSDSIWCSTIQMQSDHFKVVAIGIENIEGNDQQTFVTPMMKNGRYCAAEDIDVVQYHSNAV